MTVTLICAYYALFTSFCLRRIKNRMLLAVHGMVSGVLVGLLLIRIFSHDHRV